MKIKHETNFTSFGLLTHTCYFQKVPGGEIWEKMNEVDAYRMDTGEVDENIDPDLYVIPVEDPESPPISQSFADLEMGAFFCETPGGDVLEKTCHRGWTCARNLRDGDMSFYQSGDSNRQVIPVTITLTVENA